LGETVKKRVKYISQEIIKKTQRKSLMTMEKTRVPPVQPPLLKMDHPLKNN
jgi:hypothetical protein